MNKIIELSIIIPIYNAGYRVSRILNSILLSDKDFEVLCINDGSTDDTLSILEKYNDHRIRIFTKKNEGTFKAWQYGVHKANGKYITILDQDDYIENDYINFIYNNIPENYDLIFTPYYIEQENGNKSICEIGINSGVYKGEDYNKIKSFLLSGRVPYAKFTKVIKREILLMQVEQTYDGQLRDFEDWLTMVEVFAYSRSVLIENYAYYHYIQYGSSVSKSQISYRRNYNSLQTILTYLNSKEDCCMNDYELKSFSFYSLYCILNKSLRIREWDLIQEILNNKQFHSFIFKANISPIRKLLFGVKSIGLLKIICFVKDEIRRYKK